MYKAEIDIRLERTPEGGKPRYYEIFLAVDFFGEAALQRHWGGVGGARGGARLESYASLTAARRAASQWLRRKRRRGYRRAIPEGQTT